MWPRWVYRFSDARDRWLGLDKAYHAGLAMLLWLAVAWWSGEPQMAWFATIVAGVGVEVFQLQRMIAWMRRGMTGDWPWMTDLISPKDLIADMLGAALGHLVFVLVLAAHVLP